MGDGQGSARPRPGSYKDYYPTVEEVLSWDDEETNKLLANMKLANLQSLFREVVSQFRITQNKNMESRDLNNQLHETGRIMKELIGKIESIPAPEPVTAPATVTSESCGNSLDEQTPRNFKDDACLRTIVINGIPEVVGESALIRLGREREAAQQVLDQIYDSVQCEDVFRRGKFDANSKRIRPVVVRLR